jgi:hypothetical protein
MHERRRGHHLRRAHTRRFTDGLAAVACVCLFETRWYMRPWTRPLRIVDQNRYVTPPLSQEDYDQLQRSDPFANKKLVCVHALRTGRLRTSLAIVPSRGRLGGPNWQRRDRSRRLRAPPRSEPQPPLCLLSQRCWTPEHPPNSSSMYLILLEAVHAASASLDVGHPIAGTGPPPPCTNPFRFALCSSQRRPIAVYHESVWIKKPTAPCRKRSIPRSPFVPENLVLSSSRRCQYTVEGRPFHRLPHDQPLGLLAYKDTSNS